MAVAPKEYFAKLSETWRQRCRLSPNCDRKCQHLDFRECHFQNSLRTLDKQTLLPLQMLTNFDVYGRNRVLLANGFKLGQFKFLN